MDTVFKVFWIGILVGLAPALVLGLVSIVAGLVLHLVGLPFFLLRLPLLVVASRSPLSRSLGALLDRLRKMRERIAELRDSVLIPVYRVLGRLLKYWILAGLIVFAVWASIKKPLLPIFLLFAWFLTWRVIPWLYVKIARGVFGARARMTPIAAKRVRRFKSIKRGYYSFVAISTLFVASLFLELVVNDKPLAIKYGDRLAFPAFAEWFDKVLAIGWWTAWALLGLAVLALAWRGLSALRRSIVGAAAGPAAQRLSSLVALGVLLLFVLPLVGIGVGEAASSISRPTASPFQKRSDFGQLSERAVDYARFKRWADDPTAMRADLDAQKAEILREREAFLTENPEPSAEEGERAHDRWERRKNRAEKGWTRAEGELAQKEEKAATFAAGDAWIVMPLYPHHYEEFRMDLGKNPPNKPSIAQGIPLGTDTSGRDVVPLLLYGFRISLAFALIVAALGYLIGIVVGGVQGYYGGWVDILSQRFVEIWGSIPFLFTMMIIASMVAPNLIMLIVLLVILRSWLGITYYVRGEFYREKAKDYVQAAIGAGVSDKKIILGHILPNSLVPVVTFAPFGIVAYIGSLVSLDFLGFGLPHRHAELGRAAAAGPREREVLPPPRHRPLRRARPHALLRGHDRRGGARGLRPQGLLEAEVAAMSTTERKNLVEIRDLKTYFDVEGRTAKAVDGVSFDDPRERGLRPGRRVGERQVRDRPVDPPPDPQPARPRSRAARSSSAARTC